MPGNLVSWFGAAIIVCLAAALQGITGFGFALISVPLLFLVYDPHTAVGINIIISFFSLLVLTIRVRQAVIRPAVLNLFFGSLVGIPLGVYIFLHFNVQELKLMTGIVTALCSLMLLRGVTIKNATGTLWERIIGSISGFLTGSIGMPGPPIILFLSNQHLPKERFRATSAAYFTLVYPASLLLLISLGGINAHVALTALTLIPFAVLGGYLGYRLFPLIPQAQFQRGVPLLVLGTAIYAVFTSLP
ncbi:sulfite exporter TauE/SafE family protein [Thermanaeromonas sp. C210]|uniref:sulfite exporter TauE/SafE family protein n=1 Tax=Thermanaeromonas sp. C210 TaxID=2731925 RepID=UPI00155BF850|nr:sulfite exporter TauE/SafE family protein [Thermanaeromonas sp. C210]GFN22309.1 anion permease [Thermanaeromonas sp. C210]